MVQSELVFDIKRGPNLKQLIWLYYRVKNVHAYHTAIFEDMHDTNFWKPYYAFCSKEHQLLSCFNLVNWVQQHLL